MENNYSDLFDLYLEDIADKDTIPEDFIISSKVIFISNSPTLPSKVKDHTLSFVIDTTKEDAKKKTLEQLTNVANSLVDAEIDNGCLIQAFEDTKIHKDGSGTLEDLFKYLIIRASGLPEDRAKTWMVEQ